MKFSVLLAISVKSISVFTGILKNEPKHNQRLHEQRVYDKRRKLYLIEIFGNNIYSGLGQVGTRY